MRGAGDFLFSIDLEDVRDHVRNGHSYSERVPGNTERYLGFLKAHGVRATFFVVGLVAERYPGLIKDIVAEGHEIACHTHTHVQLDKHTPESLEADLKRNLEVLYRCGAADIAGFRAPTFSMMESTRWAYPVIEKLGFRYSSSVFPARNPLYAWPEFGVEPRMIGKVLEMPITIHPRLFRVPIAGGVHFRVLPFFLVERGIKALTGQGRVIQSYFHPYDIDTGQERFMHPDLSENRVLNALMYVGRARVFSRLERVMDICRFVSYRDYLGKVQS
jgi:polysaccharide deacetylase family protein (PEP-CTERM system associated)